MTIRFCPPTHQLTHPATLISSWKPSIRHKKESLLHPPTKEEYDGDDDDKILLHHPPPTHQEMLARPADSSYNEVQEGDVKWWLVRLKLLKGEATCLSHACTYACVCMRVRVCMHIVSAKGTTKCKHCLGNKHKHKREQKAKATNTDHTSNNTYGLCRCGSRACFEPT